MTRDRIGRALLWGSALFVLLALLWNPEVPGTDPVSAGAEGAGAWVLVDPHPLLAHPDSLPPGASAMASRALRDRLSRPELAGATLALALPRGLQVLARPGEDGGDALEAAPVDRPPDPEVTARILRDLVDAGADSILLLSTFRGDPAPLDAVLDSLEARARRGMAVPPVRLEALGGALRNAGVAELSVPRDLALDRPFTAAVRIRGEGGTPADSVDVRLLLSPGEGGQVELARTRIPLPPEGDDALVELDVPGGWATDREEVPRVLGAAVELEGDEWPADDRQEARLDALPDGILLISVAPDWEPRTLLPVLERSTGLPAEGWLRTGPPGEGARWLPLHGPDAAPPAGSGAPLPETGDLAPRIRSARLLVLHGVGPEPLPEPLGPPAAAHRTVLHLPAGPEGLDLAGLEGLGPGPAAVRPGRWSVDPQLPASAIRGALGVLSAPGLPTLEGGMEPPALAPGEEPLPGVEVALRIRRTGEPDARPALVLLEHDGGRAAVALARDFRRWGARDGAPRQAYLELWSGVAGWLLAGEGARGGTGAGAGAADRDADRDADPDRGAAPDEDPGADPDSDSAPFLAPGTVGADGALRPRSGLPERRGGTGDATVATALIPDDVAPDDEAPDDEGPGEAGAHEIDSGEVEADATRPLRSHPAPWVLLVGLLLALWILRRRAGLP